MNAIIRRYTGASRLIEAMDRSPQEIERLMANVPGFVSYHAVRAGDTLVSVTVCRDHAGIEESARRAAGWIRETLPEGAVGAPEITDGEAFVSFMAPQTLGAGAVRA